MKLPRFALLALLLCLPIGCRTGNVARVLRSASTTPPLFIKNSGPIRFETANLAAGIHFTLSNHGRSPLTILETSGGGCAFVDYDADSWPDILLVGPHNLALYHNERNGTFTDVTSRSGLDPTKYWMGCAVGDYDGDGYPDLFLTGYHCCALYHNEGSGRFRDVTAQSGIHGLEWSMSAVFADMRGTGRLDLFVSQYVHFDASTPQTCKVGRVLSACGPEVYQPLSGKLFLNRDGQRFEAAPWQDTGKTWGALASDLFGTGHPLLYLANDMMPADLWKIGPAKPQNLGYTSGTALDGQGHLQGGMGVDSGDYDNDGRLDLVVTTYFAQPISLYHNDGGGLFSSASGETKLGPPSTPYVKFGTGFVDLDNDGWLDLLVTSGHVRDNIYDIDAAQAYKQPVQVFRNEEGHAFQDVSATAGALPSLSLVGRGLTWGDYDHDGRMDALICNLEGEAVLLHNISPAGHWLDVRLTAPGLNREGIGALITLKSGDLRQQREIRTSGSVLSAQIPIAHFGLGTHSGPVTIQVRWPDGKTQTTTTDKTDTLLTVKRS